MKTVKNILWKERQLYIVVRVPKCRLILFKVFSHFNYKIMKHANNSKNITYTYIAHIHNLHTYSLYPDIRNINLSFYASTLFSIKYKTLETRLKTLCYFIPSPCQQS